MGDEGEYIFRYLPSLGKQTGRGDGIRALYSDATWKWRRMSASDYNWWRNTLVGVGGSLFCNGNTVILVDTMQFTTNLVQLIVHQPTYGYLSNGYLYNVEVRFTHILLTP